MIPIYVAYGKKQPRLQHLKRNYLQGGIDAINISHVKILGLEPPGRMQKWEAEITLAAEPSLTQFQPGMEVMLRDASNNNLYAVLLKRIDTVNKKLIVDINENIQSATFNGANVIPWGVCQLQNDTFDSTPIMNNIGEIVGLQYDENGEFLIRMDKSDLETDLLAMQVNATVSVTIALQVSLDGVNWNTPDNWTNVVISADGVASGGVSACPYGYTKIIYYSNSIPGWLRLTTSDLATGSTYYINIAT